MSKETSGKVFTESYWRIEPRVVLPPDLIREIGKGNEQKDQEALEWLNKYGYLLLRAQRLNFLGGLDKWVLTDRGEVRYKLITRYPTPIALEYAVDLLYPEDRADVKKRKKMRDKIYYLSPFFKSLGMIFVLEGVEEIIPPENPQKMETQNE